jgi:hypothetical protein
MRLFFRWSPAWSGCWLVKQDDGPWCVVSHSPDGWADRLKLLSLPQHSFLVESLPAEMLEWLGVGLNLEGN